MFTDEIKDWKSPSPETKAYEYTNAFDSQFVLESFNRVMKAFVVDVHRLESQGENIAGATEIIESQQKCERLIAWFRKYWRTDETRILLVKPLVKLEESETISVDEALENWSKNASN
jgi:hypothetical protein